MTRHSDEKEKFLEILATTPFINYAAKQVGISRATIYRWMKDNKRFRLKVSRALSSGRDNLVEVGETVLVSKMKKGDLNATKFFLSHNSNRYRSTNPIIPETLLEKKNILSAITSDGGTFTISKRSIDIVQKMKAEERRRKNKAMGFPDKD